MADMMDGFASDADTPSNCAHALRTLMLYDEVSWFHDVQTSYGQRFYNNAKVQHVIAQGLCRFGDYTDAIVYCQKAIVLGAGAPAEELLQFCQKMEGCLKVEAAKELQYEAESNLRAYLPLLSLGTAVVVVFAGFGLSTLRTHKAWLINGTLNQYTFLLDDKLYTLPQGGCRQVQLQLGRHVLEMDALPSCEFSYSIPFIKQLLQRELLIINPDGLALFSIPQKTESSEVSTLYHGEQVHALAGVSYPLFKFSRQEREQESGQSIQLYRPNTHVAMAEKLNEFGLSDAAQTYAQRVLLYDPFSDEAEALLSIAVQGMTLAEIQSFLAKGIESEPVLMPWHIFYQDLMLKDGHDAELREEYKKRCQSHPEQPESYFLLGRIVENREVAFKFFEQSEKGAGMNGLGYHTIASDLYLRGEYKQARNYSRKALIKNPDEGKYSALHENILFALREFDDLLTLIDLENPALTEKAILYLTCAGYHREAEALISAHGNTHPAIGAQLNASRFYATGNLTSYLSCRMEAGHPQAQFEKLLYNNQVAEAHKELSRKENHAWEEHLVLYCLAESLENKTISSIHWTRALNEFKPTSRAQFLAVELLKAEVVPQAESIEMLDMDVRQKALICMSLAYRFPEHHEVFCRLSEKYNFTPRHPQLFIKTLQRKCPSRKKKQLRPAA
ncbi:hypothetical protein P4B35_14415 [Pontiellaceae bacterium B12227]|nr:hypothetical protein [Pontiellaceae bacterium B12227]